MCPTLCDHMDCSLPGSSLSPWNFPGKSTGVGCHFLLQGIFPTQGLDPGLLHCRQIIYNLSQSLSKLWILKKKPVNSQNWRDFKNPLIYSQLIRSAGGPWTPKLMVTIWSKHSLIGFSSVQFSHSVMSNSLWPHGLQQARPPFPSPTPRVCSGGRVGTSLLSLEAFCVTE